MADVVQYRLERMVDELDDLERRGIFTRAEISEIVKQRRKFEYRLKRPSPLKQDFLAYIDYESQLDELRRLRRKAVLLQSGEKKKKKSISDYGGVAKIVEVYRLATRRFKGDINLWFKYLEFCRQKRNGRMKKVLAEVIRFHPKVAEVWIYAAAWEFDRNLNVAAARALMQNGLRVCPNSEDLWVEYLRMELTYLNKLKARRVALGEGEGSLVRDKKSVEDEQWKDENKELFMSLDDKEEKDKDGSGVDDDEDDEDANERVDIFKEKGSNVLQAIYGGAVEALPSSFDMRRRFLEILEATDLAHSDDIRNTILGDLKRDFSSDPEYWNWLARHEMSGCLSVEFANPQMQKAIQVLEEGLQTVTSSAMFEMYIKFLMEAIERSSGDDDEISPSSDSTGEFISHLLNVYENADAAGCLTEELANDYVSLYLKLGRIDDALKLAENLCSGKFAGSAKLWLTRVSIETRSLSSNSTPSKADLQSVFELLSNALKKVPIAESESLWLMAFKFFAQQKKYFDKLVEMSILSVAKGNNGSDPVFSLASVVVKLVLQTKGIHSAREIYKRFLALPRPGLVLYKDCIEIETNLASQGDKDSLRNVRKLYDSAVASYSQDVELWKDYYSLETQMGTSETANGVYWRARKTLKEAADFVVGS
ncbi:hypothetical protein N665_0365s0031 [Sinapis alba]|nr:hypothetical protein N665_0365s0031 [Sinapis alba]